MSSIQHIAFNCLDRKKQEEFLTRFFGFRRVRVFNAGRPDEFVMLRLGDSCIELFSAPAGAAPVAASPTGFQHLAFEVYDIDAKVQELREAGYATQDIIDCSDAAPGLRVCFFKDADGNTIELMQNWTDEASLDL